MASVTLHPFGSGPTRNRAIAPSSAPIEPAPRLAPFWGSLFHEDEVAANEPAAPTAESRPSTAVVGGLWIQIR